ncbi:MAG TPA: tetratricopeptide repeat protein, partial [Caldilineaceae bacterium]|nr:tetratricopeptide repeat protein [Caldilineaceae bacterium]
TFSRGSISRVHTWAPLDMALFQVDVNVTGGQRGSVLVSERGEVVGIMTLPLPNAQAALVASAADLAPRLTALLSQAGVALSDRRPLESSAQTEHMGLLDGNLEADLYLLAVEPGTDVRLEVEGIGRPTLEVVDRTGMAVAVSEAVAASEAEGDRRQVAAFSAPPGAGLYLVRVTQLSLFRNHYTLRSDHPLYAYEDPDGGALTLGETRLAALDAPGDWDTYAIELKRGDKVAVEVDALALDPVINLLYRGPAREDLVVDGGSGFAGLAGEAPRLVYEAPADAAYTLVVRDASGGNIGGYLITVRAAEAGEAPTEPASSRTFYFSPFGRLEQYTSERNDFSFKYPAYWSSVECPDGATACFQGGEEALLLIAEEETGRFGLPDMSQEAYVDLVAELMAEQLPDSQMVSQGVIVTPQGLEGETLVFSGDNGRFTVSRFIYVNDEGVAFNATYFVPTEVYAELRPALSYTYSTFRSWSHIERTEDPVYHMDEGAAYYAQQEYEQAEEALSRAIELDPELADAYALRANVYSLMGEPALAVADLETAIALAERDSYYASLANVHWTNGANDLALEAINRAIELEPEAETHYNTRALIYATLGELEAALADIERHAELVDGELEAYALDTRAYIYLKMESYEEALADYEAALGQDFQVAHTLLGAGIVYARLDRMEQALPLLAYGMERAEEEQTDPQLAELLGWAEALIEAAPGEENQ